MAIKVYGRLSSANVQKVNWFCDYANLSIKNLNYGGIYGGTKTNSFVKMNPNSRIPVLVDNKITLYESNAILRYLSRKSNFLNEKNILINAKIDQWIDWGSFTFASPCSILTANKLSLPKEQRNEVLAQKAKDDILILLGILDNNLSDKSYVVGNKFSLADIPLGIWCHRCVNLEIDLKFFFNVYSWYSKLKKISSFNKSVFSAPIPPN